MPPSSDQDNSNTLSSSPQPSKPSQKATTGLQNPTKNGRKNGTAKDVGGGVLAAVTKNASKSSNAKPVPAPQTNRIHSPDMKPAGSPSNGNPVTSPLLDALSSAALDRSPSQHTNEWARNVPAYSSSPSNLINLGESPPTLSYEDRLANFGWTTREQRGIPNGHVPSASPPSSRRRPLSYQLDSNSPQGTEDHRPQVSSYAARRSSMYSQHPRYTQHPPLPHQAQAHFYGAPDANLMLSPPTPGLVPGENGLYSGFDILPTPQYLSKAVDDVVVNGYEGGVNICAISKRGVSKVSVLEGLRGSVYNAKILPWTAPGSSSLCSPLIALVIHGPFLTTNASTNSGDQTPSSEDRSGVPTESLRGPPRIHGQPIEENEPIEYYQTTVEVYSLGMKNHVATLLALPKIRLAHPTTSPMFRAPEPAGSLTIRADSGNVIVASGTTGETWIFRQGDREGVREMFKCIGKVWTTLQHGITVESQPNILHDDWHAADQPLARKQYNAPTISMNGRWLAYCPSVPSSQISLRAIVPGLSSSAKVPGLTSHAPPNLPNTNCTVDTPGGESVMKQIVQIGTQKFIEAGNYLTQQGLSAWNNYRSKPPQNQPAAGGLPYQSHGNTSQQFPPTHGLQTPAPLVTKDPGLISILDLEALAQHPSSTGSSPHPLATFRIPHGCSFLSFAPNGLALFTASNKGDIQFVWDLMRIQYAKSSFLVGTLQGSMGTQGPHVSVRQIAQFSRMTIARIVDVVWTSTHGERFAMVTEPGTVHVLDLPASAFAWPPPRRRTPSQKAEEPNNEIVGSALTATGVATSAVNSLWTAARPLVGRRRRSSVGLSARTVTAQAGHGTQALAAGISRSVGAATGKMNEMRKSANTRLHLPPSQNIPSRGCVLLLNGRRNDSVVVLGAGIVRFYTIKNRRADRPADKQKASRGAKFIEFRLPSLPNLRGPEITQGFSQIKDLELTERDIEESHWKARLSPPPVTKVHGTESSIPQAEIESNAPYQPFHTDRRVGLHIYSEAEVALPSSPSVSTLISPSRACVEVRLSQTGQPRAPWVFGGPIHTTKLDVGPPHNPDDDFDLSSDHRALPSSAIERVLKVTDSTEDMEQIVITTRRRKGTSRAGPDNTGDGLEEGFFEDDCEVLDFASQRV
ncbi:hypothetical protein BKA65DRAFT_449081 [Rhexocercosporidium sp. MPI-PUGE-AT-0058]|nr:hypothetical protein BKA65DRAFT_449081 [Rhexocercosporidium sp. MPI-PUGE-AT-0058]